MLPAFVATVAKRITRYAPQPKPSCVATDDGSESAGLNCPVWIARNTTPSAPTKNHHVCAMFAPIHGPTAPVRGVRAKREKSPMNSQVQLYATSRSSSTAKVMTYVYGPIEVVSPAAGRQAKRSEAPHVESARYDSYAP